MESNAEEISHTARQAIEIYRASQSVSMYAKPILLYYCYRRLSSILFLATYEWNFQKAERGSDIHGLRMDHKEFVPIDPIIVDKSRDFILELHISPDDAIHLYTAFFKRCEYFICHDEKLTKRTDKKIPDMRVVDVTDSTEMNILRNI